MAAERVPFITPEKYLEIERAAGTKSEYLSGQMFAMAGGTYEHGLIMTNLVWLVRSALRERPCTAVGSDLRLQVRETGLYTYPDLMIICGGAEFGAGRDIVTNPTVIFEILSPSTQAYDRGEKWAHYQRIETLREYVLISQTRIRVEKYTLGAGQWIYTDLSSPDMDFRLESVGIEISCGGLYDGVELPPDANQPGH